MEISNRFFLLHIYGYIWILRIPRGKYREGHSFLLLVKTRKKFSIYLWKFFISFGLR